REIGREACALLLRGAPPLPLRLVGVTVAGIRPVAASIGGQMSLFEKPKPTAQLDRALDAIADRFGTAAVRRGGGAAAKASPTLGVKRGE
ncbi:MAG: hypothetical protein ACKOCT_03275, partial [Alphaproteobacteria bacterium]